MMRNSIKHIMKNARRKLEIPLPAAMLCKLQRDKYRENCWAVGQNNTKYVCIVEANDSMRIRMEGSRLKNHEDHTAGTRMNSLSHYNMVHKFTPMPQALKIPDAKAAVEKECEKMEESWHGSGRKSETKMRCSLMQGGQKSIFRRWWISVISRIRSWSHSFKNTKVESYSEVTL